LIKSGFLDKKARGIFYFPLPSLCVIVNFIAGGVMSVVTITIITTAEKVASSMTFFRCHKNKNAGLHQQTGVLFITEFFYLTAH